MEQIPHLDIKLPINIAPADTHKPRMDAFDMSSASTTPSPLPFLVRLAQLLLAKAERSTRTGPARLPLNRKVAPELHDAVDAEQIQLLHMQLDDLCATGWVTLLVDAPRAFSGFTDRNPRLELCDFEALATWSGYTPQAQRWRQQWRTHLAAFWETHPEATPADPTAVLEHLARNPLIHVEGLPIEDATRSLADLTELCQLESAAPLRELSARVFQGRSKALDHREELLRLLGASPGQFTEAPIQLLLAPPQEAPTGIGNVAHQVFTDVLFIENLVTFEHMADVRMPAWSNSLLVFAAGFRGSARRLRTRGGCRLYLRAPTPSPFLSAIEAWLFGHGQHKPGHSSMTPVHFFGDLDHAGMQILVNLREIFPNANAWRPGYAYLASLLASGMGHPPELAAKAQQTDPVRTNCPYADDELLPLMRKLERFIDQESFDPWQLWSA